MVSSRNAEAFKLDDDHVNMEREEAATVVAAPERPIKRRKTHMKSRNGCIRCKRYRYKVSVHNRNECFSLAPPRKIYSLPGVCER